MTSEPEWTVEQAAELLFEQVVTLLDGCDDDDTTRPALVLEALRQVWSPNAEIIGLEDISAGELRRRMLQARARLAVEKGSS
jgi:hypothetical protein